MSFQLTNQNGPRPRTPNRLILIALCLCPVLAADEPLEDNSPFLPPNFGKKEEEKKVEVVMQGPVSQAVEFRSMVKIGDEWNFSLYDLKENKSVWLTERQSSGQYKVESFNVTDKRIQLTMQGKTEWLALKTPSGEGAKPPPVAPVARNPAQDNPELRSAAASRVRLNRSNIPRRRVVVPTRQEEQTKN